MLLLACLLGYRSYLTPNFIHLLSAVEDDEAHCVCVMLIWLCYRCFLEPDMQVTKATTVDRVWQERLRIFARCFLELLVTLLVLTPTFDSMWPWVYCTTVLLIAAARSVWKEWLDWPILIAGAAYLLQNLIVNLLDLAFQKHSLHFETDLNLVNLFSYKLWQLVHCGMIGFIFG